MIYLEDSLGCKYSLDRPSSRHSDTRIIILGSDSYQCDLVIIPTPQDIQRIKDDLRKGKQNRANIAWQTKCYRTIEPKHAFYDISTSEIWPHEDKPLRLNNRTITEENKTRINDGDAIELGALVLKVVNTDSLKL